MGIVAFSLGELNIYSYGLLVSVAILLGLLVTKLHLFLRKERWETLTELFLYGIIGGIVGARIGYVVLNFSVYSQDFSEIIAINHGGVSIYGAFIGLLFAVFVYSRLRHLCFWHCLDILTPALLLGGSLMQLGHFGFQVTVGLPVSEHEVANSKIIEYIEYSFRPAGFQGYEYFKPVALYQAVWQFCLFIAAAVATREDLRRKLTEGNIFLSALILTCLGRVAFGFLYLGSGNGLSVGQVICLAAAAGGCLLLAKKRRIVAEGRGKRACH